MKDDRDIGRAEREVIRWAMKRLQEWKMNYPDGLIPWGKDGSVNSKAGHNMIRACLKLEKLRCK